MLTFSLPPGVLRGLGLFLLLLAPAAAQNLLIAEVDGKPHAVIAAHGLRPVVELNGKPEIVNAYHFALKPVDEYFPAIVAVRYLSVKNSFRRTEGTPINNEFHFQATFEAPYRLDNVYVVLELNAEDAGPSIFLEEIGRLEPHAPRSFTWTVPLSSPLGRGKYKFHVFSAARELLHTGIPEAQREAVVDRMTVRRLQGVQDADPHILFGPGPEYPAKLLKARVAGRAVIALHISARGEVTDPVVKEASDPAFGESALEAARLARFIPKVVAGRPVETTVMLPYDFAPPSRE